MISDSLTKLLSRREFALIAAFLAGNTVPAPRRRETVSSSPAKPSSASGSVFNVKDYGAIGNGTANDADAIQAAVAAAQATPYGGRICFPPGIYYTGTQTISISRSGIVLEMADSAGYIRYAGTGYAISFAVPGPTQIHHCGMILVSVVCTKGGGGGVYAKSPYGFFLDHCYFENGERDTTSSTAITIDTGTSSNHTGYFATHNVIDHVRCNGFLKGILFKGGSLAGEDISTASVVRDCFVNAQPGLPRSVGVEFQGAQQCTVRGGNLESLVYGIRLVSRPSRCIGITIDGVRFEAIAANSWVIPADSENCAIIAPRWNENNGSDLAADTILLQNSRSRFNAVSLVKRAVNCSNGNNNHTLDRQGASFIRISGPTAVFAIGGFSLDRGGFKATDGTELTVYNATAVPMTINAGDPRANESCAIRTPTGSDITLPAGPGGSSARFVYDAAFPQWILVSTSG